MAGCALIGEGEAVASGRNCPETNLMGRQAQRRRRLIHSVIAAAGDGVASVGRGHKQGHFRQHSL